MNTENKFIMMDEILERLEEWKQNTDIDIKNDYTQQENKQDYIRQSITLAQCIGMLKTLGENSNIKTN